jgi:hypothetical protein
MSTPTNPGQEHPSTYWVQDRSDEEELTRLRLQDQMLTADMGGVLSEQPDPAVYRRVLDVSCGTGGWLIEAAKTYPSMSLLVGLKNFLIFIDVHRHFLVKCRHEIKPVCKESRD